MKKRSITLLGSTGSIGVQTLDVVRQTGCAKVVGLACHSNIRLLMEQILEFAPERAAVADENKARELRASLSAFGSKTEVLSGLEGVLAVAAMEVADMALDAMVGSAGLLPAVAAIQAGLDLALANKETLVAAGELIMPMAKARGVSIIPVDSEHSAIFQCLSGQAANEAEQIYLTASGGPFRQATRGELEDVTPEDALRHPNWSMGKKVTIDSATLMNKGLEVIEARWLFDIPPERITVLVHPQSVVHSMVEFADGAVLAQLGAPDMRVPIQYALTYPQRVRNTFPRLDFVALSGLTFEQPRTALFPCLALAYGALERGGLYPAIMNAANEIAVSLFLDGKLKFMNIPSLIEKTMSAYNDMVGFSLDAVLEVDAWAREFAAGHSGA